MWIGLDHRRKRTPAQDRIRNHIRTLVMSIDGTPKSRFMDGWQPLILLGLVVAFVGGFNLFIGVPGFSNDDPTVFVRLAAMAAAYAPPTLLPIWIVLRPTPLRRRISIGLCLAILMAGTLAEGA